MFFVHCFILNLFLGRLDKYIPSYNGDSNHGVYVMIAIFFTCIFFSLSIIIILIEKRMLLHYKRIMFFVAYSNCLIDFYVSSLTEYRLFSSPERFDTSSIVAILIYFILELFLTYFVVNSLYKSEKSVA